MAPPLSAARLARAAALLTLLLCAPASAGEAETLHGSWRACLSRNFALQSAITGRDLAADNAFHACRSAEDAYLAALAASPLLDEDDLARARPALARTDPGLARRDPVNRTAAARSAER